MSDLDEAIRERDAARLDATRARVAHELNLRPGDHEFLTGTDDGTVRRQAIRLADADRRAENAHLMAGNYVSREGSNPTVRPSGDHALRQFVNDLFGSGDPL